MNQLNGGRSGKSTPIKNPSIHTVYANARVRRALADRPLPSYEDDGIRFVGITELSLEAWMDIPDHPHQRDTAKHAHNSQHLRVFSDSHRRVAIGIMPDGRRIKGDGHTRTFMWTHGMTVGVPENVRMVADTYELADERALAKFYELFDNKSAVDTLADEVTSATKAASLTFNSQLMKSGRFVSALRLIHRLMTDDPEIIHTLRDGMTYLTRELLLLDGVAPTNKDFNGGITMAALLAFARDGERAVDFWDRYGHGRGWKQDNDCDAVEALINFRTYVRADKQSGSGQMMRHFKHAMSAYIGYCESPSRIYQGKAAKPRAVSEDTLWRFIKQAQTARPRLLRGA